MKLYNTFSFGIFVFNPFSVMRIFYLLIACFFLFLTLGLNAQSAWTRITPTPQENTINDIIRIPGTSKLVAVGECSTVMFSSDEGDNWTILLNPAGMDNSFNIKKAWFIDEQTGYLCGSGYTILKTTDGGSHWELKYQGDSTTEYDYLCDIRFMDEMNGLAVGTYGHFLRTYDGGESWSVVPNTMSATLLSIVFANSQIGYIIGGSQMIKTTDGGITWNVTAWPAGLPRCTEMYFVNDSVGLAFYYYVQPSMGYILRTTDAGITWVRVYLDPNLYEGNFCFFDDLNGVCGSPTIYYSTKMLVTNDGGISWSGDINYDMPYYSTNSIVQVDQTTAISGGLYGSLFKTNDRGETWNSLTTRKLWGNMIAAQFPDPENGYVLSESLWGGVLSTSLMKTEDGGSSWTDVSPGFQFYSALNFLSPDTGFLYAEPYNALFRTLNGGNSWDFLQTNFNFAPQLIHFLDYEHGYVGAGGYLDRSIDGGETWNPVTTGMEGMMAFHVMLHKGTDTLYIGGDANGFAALLRSFDGGNTWETIFTGEDGTFRDLCFGEGQSLYGICMDHILISVDGGDNWMNAQTNNESPVYFSSICFPTADTGYAVGKGLYENILKTVDGGENWSPIDSDISSGLNFVKFKDADHGIILGEGGVEAFTTDGGITGFAFPAQPYEEIPFQIFPNPAIQTASVTLSGEMLTKTTEVQIITFQGVLVKRFELKEKNEHPSIQIEALKPGCYLVQLLENEKVIQSRKLIIL